MRRQWVKRSPFHLRIMFTKRFERSLLNMRASPVRHPLPDRRHLSALGLHHSAISRMNRRSRVAPTAPRAGDDTEALYSVADIVDAPEHYAYARAMGLLTWGTWDVGERPIEERLEDLLQAYPPNAPARFQGAMLVETSDGEHRPARDH